MKTAQGNELNAPYSVHCPPQRRNYCVAGRSPDSRIFFLNAFPCTAQWLMFSNTGLTQTLSKTEVFLQTLKTRLPLRGQCRNSSLSAPASRFILGQKAVRTPETARSVTVLDGNGRRTYQKSLSDCAVWRFINEEHKDNTSHQEKNSQNFPNTNTQQ